LSKDANVLSAGGGQRGEGGACGGAGGGTAQSRAALLEVADLGGVGAGVAVRNDPVE